MIEKGQIWEDDKECLNCGKHFTVLHPTRLAYKTKAKATHYKYFCSWKCLREYENGNKEKITMKKANNTKPRMDRRDTLINLIAAFEDECKAPIEFLKEEGYKKADNAWYALRKWAKYNEPELYEKLMELKLIRPAAEVTVSDRLPEKDTLEDRLDKIEEKVELVYDSSIKDEYERDLKLQEERGRRIAERMDKADRARREMINGIEPLQVAALYSRTIDGAKFKKMDGGMILATAEYCIRMTAYEWFKLTEEILVAIRQLDATAETIDGDEK